MKEMNPTIKPLNISDEGSFVFLKDQIVSVCNDSLMKFHTFDLVMGKSEPIEGGIYCIASPWRINQKNVILFGGDTGIVYQVVDDKFAWPYPLFKGKSKIHKLEVSSDGMNLLVFNLDFTFQYV